MRQFTRIIGVPGLSNLGVVRDGAVYRSAQPTSYEGFSAYLGGKSVLCLRESDHRSDAEKAGLIYIPFHLNVLSNITIDDCDLLIAAMMNRANWPMLVSCRDGVDRTGFTSALHRLSQDGWTLADALEEMDQYGAHEILDPLLIKHLTDYAEAKGFK